MTTLATAPSGMIEQLLADQRITTHFQPIVDLADGRIVGYEALSRGPAGSALESPRLLFAAAEHGGRLRELEQVCWDVALRSAATHEPRRAPLAKLFLNVLPDQLDLHFLDVIVALLHGVRLDPSQVVVELTEGMRIDDYQRLLSLLTHYRAAGFAIAIDDAGAGHSGLQTIAELNPDYVKIDRALVHDIDRHVAKRATVEALLLLARSLSITVIAEGIEREEELEELRRLRVPCGQGHLLASPAEVPPPVSHAAGRVFASAFPIPMERRLRRTPVPERGGTSIGALVSPGTTCQANAELRTVIAALDETRGECAVIVDDTGPIGLLTRSRADQLLARPNGRMLYLRRSAGDIARGNPLIVRHDESLETVSRLAMARPADALYEDIIVTRNGVLTGTVSVQHLLEAITDVRIAWARHANPLTGLPGNPVIEHEIRARLRAGRAISVLYIDLDDFKAFNDTYGFHHGDCAIRMAAALLSDEIIDRGADDAFLGHIGGDDFLAVVPPGTAARLPEQLTDVFAIRSAALYDEEDRSRGYMLARGPGGERYPVALMTMTVASIVLAGDDRLHHAELLDALAEARRSAKARSRVERAITPPAA